MRVMQHSSFGGYFKTPDKTNSLTLTHLLSRQALLQPLVYL